MIFSPTPVVGYILNKMMKLRSGKEILSGHPLPNYLNSYTSSIEYNFNSSFHHLAQTLEESRLSNDKNKRIIAAANILKLTIIGKYYRMMRENKFSKLHKVIIRKCEEFSQNSKDYYENGEITQKTFDYIQNVIKQVEMVHKKFA
jgi:hypothetical protein